VKHVRTCFELHARPCCQTVGEADDTQIVGVLTSVVRALQTRQTVAFVAHTAAQMLTVMAARARYLSAGATLGLFAYTRQSIGRWLQAEAADHCFAITATEHAVGHELTHACEHVARPGDFLQHVPLSVRASNSMSSEATRTRVHPSCTSSSGTAVA
jgi:hypothetical protein